MEPYTHAFTAEAQDCGFDNLSQFIACQAGLRRLALLYDRGEWDGIGSQQQREQLGDWLTAQQVAPEQRFLGREGCGYELFPDGSLYVSSNANDEIWAFAPDYATRYLLNRDDIQLTEQDAQLLYTLEMPFTNPVIGH